MTNRQRLLKTNEYDFLLKLNERIKYIEPVCIIDALTGGIGDMCDVTPCKECIQKWLNEEEQI